MSIVIVILVFCVMLFLLLRGLPKAPPVESEGELVNQGFNIKEAKKEARAQRNEHRTQRRLTNTSVRTATRVSNLAARLAKRR